MWHRARQQLVVGAVFLVLATGCSGGAAVEAGNGASDGVAAPVAPVITVPTTATIVEPLPSPTALVIDQPAGLPTAVPPPTPVPTAAAPTTEAAVTPVPSTGPSATQPAIAVTAVPATPVPVAGSQQVLAANGAEVYTLNCARCHGENGLGAGQYSAGLIGVGSQYSTAGMIAELTTGHPVTFGFADRLSAEEIASVVAYVKSVFP